MIIQDIKCFLFGKHDYEIIEYNEDIWKLNKKDKFSKEYKLQKDMEGYYLKYYSPAKIRVCVNCGKIIDESIDFQIGYKKQQKNIELKNKIDRDRKEKAKQLYNIFK